MTRLGWKVERVASSETVFYCLQNFFSRIFPHLCFSLQIPLEIYHFHPQSNTTTNTNKKTRKERRSSARGQNTRTNTNKNREILYDTRLCTTIVGAFASLNLVSDRLILYYYLVFAVATKRDKNVP